MFCNVDDRLTGFLIKELGLIPNENTFDRLTSINCNSIMLQHMAASRLWRGVLFPSAVPQIKIVGWAYFFDIILSTIENIFLKHNFKDVPAVFFASGRMRGKVGRRLLYLHFLLQVRHLLASHRNHKYPNATKNIKMPPKISKCNHKYPNATTNIQMPPKISKCHHRYPNDTKKFKWHQK